MSEGGRYVAGRRGDGRGGAGGCFLPGEEVRRADDTRKLNILGNGTGLCEVRIPVGDSGAGLLHCGPPGIGAHHEARESPLCVAFGHAIGGGLVFLSTGWASQPARKETDD